MRAFYEEHYRPDAMCLAVLGREGLDELQAWVLDEFGSLPAPTVLPSPTAAPTAAPAPGHDAADDEPLSPATSLPLSPAQLGSTLSVRPVREARSLRLMWAVPPEKHWQPSKAPTLTPTPTPNLNPNPNPNPNPNQGAGADRRAHRPRG